MIKSILAAVAALALSACATNGVVTTKPCMVTFKDIGHASVNTHQVAAIIGQRYNPQSKDGTVTVIIAGEPVVSESKDVLAKVDELKAELAAACK